MVWLLAEWFSLTKVELWVQWGGYYVLFSLLFACGLGLPLPEDIPLLISGMFIAQGHMNLLIAAIVAWCGIIGGDCVLYHIGKKLGVNASRVPLLGRHVTRARIERAEALFAKWGIWVVAVGRLFAGIRGAMVVAAGATRFNFVKFVIADGLAALVSGGLFIGLGYLVGYWGGSLEHMRHMVHRYDRRILAILIVAGVLAAVYFWWRHKRHKAIADVAMEKAVKKAAVDGREGGGHG